MKVCIICELEDMWRKRLLRLVRFAILGRILYENGVGIAGHVFVRVHGDEGGRPNIRVDIVGQEAFSNA